MADSEIQHAKMLGEAEYTQIADGVLKALQVSSGRRAVGSLGLIRKLSVIFAFNRRSCARRGKLPRKNLVDALYGVLVEPQQGPRRLRLACLCALQELAPSSVLKISDFGPPVDREQLPLILTLLQGDNVHFQDMDKLLPEVLQWLLGYSRMARENAQETALQLSALCFIGALAQHVPELVRRLRVQELTATLISILREASMIPAEVPPLPKHQAKLFGTSQSKIHSMNEMDGSKSLREVFTLLNVSSTRWYSSDQIISVHVFAVIRGWLDAIYLGTADSGAEVLTDTAKDALVEHCLVTMQQACAKIAEERYVASADRELLKGALLEGIAVLDTLCCIDKTLVSRLLPDFKRLERRCVQSPGSEPLLHLAVLRFFATHGDDVGYDLQPALTAFFGQVLLRHFITPLVTMEALLFCLDHPDLLMASIFEKFFPNILKIIAWAPRTYLAEFVELLPCLMHPASCIELFHSLLDLPCLSAALENTSGSSHTSGSTAGGRAGTTAVAPHITGALMNYILRQEGGLGGTIDRLADLHNLFLPSVDNARVRAAADVAPILLRVFFDTVSADASYDIIQSVTAIMLERILRLYNLPEYAREIGAVLAEYALLFFEKYPELIVDLRKELLDFINNRKNVSDERENFFIHIVWLLGEYTGSNRDPRCTPAITDEFYEVLELFAYEVDAEVGSGLQAMETSHQGFKYKTRLMTVLISALGKLGARCQDLIPRVILCLTKIMKRQHSTAEHSSHARRILERASQIASTLQRPSIAATVLSHPWQPTDKVSARHVDPTSALALLRFAGSVTGSDLQQRHHDD
eukprot:m.777511 g.777511  ORF g.777511 m.777511 type:complete len:811 (+) comp23265_c1_seq6:330-2762(+)